MQDYEASGSGTEYLVRPALQFLGVNEPFLGTSVPGVPNGPFNRELYKLLENDSALANLFVDYLQRTFGVSASSAPSVGVVPSPLAGAPGSPVLGAVHVVYYSNYEVVYRYEAVAWMEKARMARTYSVVQRRFKKVEVSLSTSDTHAVVSLPTTDSNGNSFAFGIDDLRLFYMRGAAPENPVISVLNSVIVDEDNTYRFVFSSPIVHGPSYKLVLIFENLTVS